MAADLTGVSVLVAGAGLAGLCAARDLTAWGATVTVVEARNRVGGRVLTVRKPFADGQHAEAGGDMIDEGHHALRALADELHLTQVRILSRGFGYARLTAQGKVRPLTRSASRGWDRLVVALSDLAARYRLAERRWDSPIAAEIGQRSAAEWLDAVQADRDLRATVTGLRAFFLADPEELSLLALVDQFSSDDAAAIPRLYRIEGGNDRLPAALAAGLEGRISLGTELVALSQRGRGVRAMLKSGRQTRDLQVDYAVLALPATLLRRIPITPALPVRQHDAISQLHYGRGTKTLVQCASRFWKSPGRPLAFGSPLSFGAVWDGNEEQRGRTGILSLLAGGSASDDTQAIVERDGVAGLMKSLDWLGSRNAEIVAWDQTRWDADPWSRGGYAVFDRTFAPSLRSLLAQPCGRLYFAGEHTSIAWQGYMNGAVESGRRAAAELAAAYRMASKPANGG